MKENKTNKENQNHGSLAGFNWEWFTSNKTLPNDTMTIWLFHTKSKLGLVNFQVWWQVISKHKTNLAPYLLNFQLEVSLTILHTIQKAKSSIYLEICISTDIFKSTNIQNK